MRVGSVTSCTRYLTVVYTTTYFEFSNPGGFDASYQRVAAASCSATTSPSPTISITSSSKPSPSTSQTPLPSFTTMESGTKTLNLTAAPMGLAGTSTNVSQSYVVVVRARTSSEAVTVLFRSVTLSPTSLIYGSVYNYIVVTDANGASLGVLTSSQPPDAITFTSCGSTLTIALYTDGTAVGYGAMTKPEEGRGSLSLTSCRLVCTRVVTLQLQIEGASSPASDCGCGNGCEWCWCRIHGHVDVGCPGGNVLSIGLAHCRGDAVYNTDDVCIADAASAHLHVHAADGVESRPCGREPRNIGLHWFGCHKHVDVLQQHGRVCAAVLWERYCWRAAVLPLVRGVD